MFPMATELCLAVLSDLNLPNLVVMSRVNIQGRSLAVDVMRRRIRQAIISFLPPDELKPFWSLLNDTCSVVGGFYALQVCLGEVNPQEMTGKLELYVPAGTQPVWVSFWEHQGFNYEKAQSVNYTLSANLKSKSTLSNVRPSFPRN